MKRYTIGFVVGVLLTVIVMSVVGNPVGRYIVYNPGRGILDTKTGDIYGFPMGSPQVGIKLIGKMKNATIDPRVIAHENGY